MGEATNALASPGAAVRRLAHRSPRVRFGLHYLEMLAVMGIGMAILAPALRLAGPAVGYEYAQIRADAPALILAWMALSMTVPMVWWMSRRGHSRAANGAMAMSMIAPTAAAIGLLALGAVAELGALMGIQHVAMFPAMLVAMLAFRGEYA
jgi:Co/Zn/Cd efflux system component